MPRCVGARRMQEIPAGHETQQTQERGALLIISYCLLDLLRTVDSTKIARESAMQSGSGHVPIVVKSRKIVNNSW